MVCGFSSIVSKSKHNCDIFCLFYSDTILPIGEFSIGVEVYDSNQGVVASTVAQCDVKVASNVESTSCTSLNGDIIQPYMNENQSLLSKRSQYKFIFQSIQVTLLYINNNSEDDCSYQLFVEALEILYKYFGSNTTDLCESDYVLVCQFFACFCVCFCFVLLFFSFTIISWSVHISCLLFILSQ